jgi:Protein of unknown function (DUF3152)
MSRMFVPFAVVLCLLVPIITPISSATAFEMEGIVDRANGTFGQLRKISLKATKQPDPAGEGLLADKWICDKPAGIVRIRTIELCHVITEAPIRQAREPSLIRYRVLIEKGLEDLTTGFTKDVARILTDENGWARSGIRFKRVNEGYDLTVVLAMPASVDRLCRPLRTGGSLSCAIGGRANINAERWLYGAETWGDDVIGYHSYLINHEVGHVMGLGHAKCPSEGAPAPIMLPQTKLLDGCTANGAPTPTDLAMLKRVLPGLERRLSGAPVKRRFRRASRRYRKRFRRRRINRGGYVRRRKRSTRRRRS